jgi:hypothetical protein
VILRLLMLVIQNSLLFGECAIPLCLFLHPIVANTVLSYQPGQIVSVWFETLDQGARADGYAYPQIARIIFPSGNPSTGYPQTMNRYDVGLYFWQFTLPTGSTAVGTYIVDIGYYDPASGNPQNTFVQVVVSAPYGLYSVTVP